ncbi:MAG: hypothetical protein E6J90_23275 [Deltaproteobacteria bacterium]|nr:MAG: hypothetical protein E6J91_42250 [Deltaproteobacteria bacterium]TMQ16712.1 MAG: hypothetical protein E6J90_23275 [Deltaproteobacteria bacterium]
MSDRLANWHHVRRLADELQLQIHLAGMDARERWRAVQRRLAQTEAALAQSGTAAADAAGRELADLRDELLHLRNEIVMRAQGDFTAGW